MTTEVELSGLSIDDFIDRVSAFLKEKLLSGVQINMVLDCLRSYPEGKSKAMMSLFFKLMTSDNELTEAGNKFTAYLQAFYNTHAEKLGLNHSPFLDPAKSVLFWRQYKDGENMLISRKQVLELCYMIPPAVLLHYCIWINTGGESSSVADISKFNQDRLEGLEMASFIWKTTYGEGDQPVKFLNDLSAQSLTTAIYVLNLSDKVDDPTFFNGKCDRMLTLLKSYPLMVSEFLVDTALLHATQNDVCFHDVPPFCPAELTGKHAMLIIGGRKDSNGRYFFLIQNWWSNCQVFEVSAEYLAYSRAQVHCIVEKVTALKPTVPINYYAAAETIDAGECQSQLVDYCLQTNWKSHDPVCHLSFSNY